MVMKSYETSIQVKTTRMIFTLLSQEPLVIFEEIKWDSNPGPWNMLSVGFRKPALTSSKNAT